MKTKDLPEHTVRELLLLAEDLFRTISERVDHAGTANALRDSIDASCEAYWRRRTDLAKAIVATQGDELLKDSRMWRNT